MPRMPASTRLPVDELRTQFAALRRGATVFFDNASGAQVPDRVVDRIVVAMREMQVNKGGAYAPSRRITEAKERVRARTASFLGASDPSEVVFGPNATTLITLLARSLGDTLERGDELVVTGLDHHANIDPWRALERHGARTLRWELDDPAAGLRVADLEPLLGPRTRAVAFTAASNVLGTYTPVAEACAAIRRAGGLAVVDAVHFAPHRLPDVSAFGCDVLVFSPYKVVGPHLGAMWLGPRARERLAGHPLSFFEPRGPQVWEAGTQNHEAMLGWGAALDYLEAIGSSAGGGRPAWRDAYAAIEAHERRILARMLAGLGEHGYELYGPPGVEGRTATVAFNHPERPPEAMAEAFAAQGIAVASGHAYAYDLVMHGLGLGERGGAVRASALHYTDDGDVDRLLAVAADLAPGRA